MKTVDRSVADCRIPLGLSVWINEPKWNDARGFYLVLPILVWWRSSYDVRENRRCCGWWQLRVMLRTQKDSRPGFSIDYRWGWVLVKEAAEAEGSAA